MRVLSKHVEFINGVIHYDGKRFTGSIYQLADDGERIMSVQAVCSGTVIGDANDLGTDMIIRPNSILAEREMKTSDGRMFQGVVYDFDDRGLLHSATLYSNGKPSGLFYSYFSSGALESYFERGATGEEGESWFESGVLATLVRNGLTVTFEKDGKVGSVTLDENVSLNQLERLSLNCSPKMRLSGVGVSDMVVSRLSGVEEVRELALEDTSVGRLGLTSFSKLDSLITEGNLRLGKNEIKEFLVSLPDCRWADMDQFQGSI